MKNVVDSSGWLEFFADGPNASVFAGPILDTGNLIVPAVCLYEVIKAVAVRRGTSAAMQAVAHMYAGHVVDMDADLSISAANVSISHRLDMADSMILATAMRTDSTLWTQDADFASMDGVRFFPKT